MKKYPGMDFEVIKFLLDDVITTSAQAVGLDDPDLENQGQYADVGD